MKSKCSVDVTPTNSIGIAKTGDDGKPVVMFFGLTEGRELIKNLTAAVKELEARKKKAKEELRPWK